MLLIDEIDKSDEAFEAFLLEMLSAFQVSIPEIGAIKAKIPPLVFLTSNNVRDLGDALKRRCLHLHIPLPDRAPGGADRRHPRAGRRGAADARELVAFVQSLREMELRKVPSISETVDWARALVLLHADALDADLVRETLNVLLKFEQDIVAVEPKLNDCWAARPGSAEASRMAALATSRRPSRSSSGRCGPRRCAVSPAEAIDAHRALIGGRLRRPHPGARRALRHPGQDRREVARFDGCFDAFFTRDAFRPAADAGAAHGAAAGARGAADLPLAQMLLEGDTIGLAQAMEAAAAPRRRHRHPAQHPAQPARPAGSSTRWACASWRS